MGKDLDLYFEYQNEESKLIYAISFLWGKVSITLDSLLIKYGLNIAKFNILMIIKHIGEEEGIQQNAISKRLLVTASNITKLLDKLEKDNMIVRLNKKNDRRVKLIKITDKASKMLDEIWPLYLNEINKLTSSLEKNDKEAIKTIMIKWLEKINT